MAFCFKSYPFRTKTFFTLRHDWSHDQSHTLSYSPLPLLSLLIASLRGDHPSQASSYYSFPFISHSILSNRLVSTLLAYDFHSLRGDHPWQASSYPFPSSLTQSLWISARVKATFTPCEGTTPFKVSLSASSRVFLKNVDILARGSPLTSSSSAANLVYSFQWVSRFPPKSLVSLIHRWVGPHTILRDSSHDLSPDRRRHSILTNLGSCQGDFHSLRGDHPFQGFP